MNLHKSRWLGGGMARWLVAIAVLWIPIAALAADVPQIINFQGRLTDASNNPASGNINFTFQLFNAVSGGTALPAGSAWSEAQTLTVTNGVFNAPIGAQTPIPYSVFTSSDVYLEITVGGETLTPRESLFSSPFAMNAHALSGRTYDAFVDTFTAQTIDGLKTLSTFPQKSGTLTPSAAGEFTTKSYVDSLFVGNSVLNSTNTWTAPQTFNSSITVNQAAQFGGAGQAVQISSNAYLAMLGGLVGIGTASPEALLDIAGDGASVLVPRKSTAGDPATGVNGMIYYNGNSNKFRGYQNGVWNDMVTNAATDIIQNQDTLQVGATFYVSSGTVQNEFRVYGAIYGDGSGITSLTPANMSAGIAGIDISGNAATATLAATATNAVTAGSLAGGATTYIQLSSTLQPGSTFFTSSGTVNTLNIQNTLQLAGAPGGSGQILQSNGPGAIPTWVNPASVSALLNSSNTWTAAQTYQNATTMISSLTVASAALLGATGQAVSISSNAYLALLGGMVGIGTSAPEALLDISGDGSSVLVPRKSTAGDPATGVNGMIYYNASSNKFRGFQNNVWNDMVTNAATNIIQNQDTLQTGATFYVSSGTVLNLNIQSTLQLAGAPGGAGQMLQSNGPGAIPTWVNPAQASALLSSTNTWTADQTFQRPLTALSSVTVTAPQGVGVTYGVVAGSFTGNGAGLTSLTAANISAGTAGIDITGTAASATYAANAGSAGSLVGGSTTYIQLSSTLQSGATFFVSSGTVNALTVGNTITLPTQSVALNALVNGTLPNTVVASSIVYNSVYPGAVQNGIYPNITGVGSQSQSLSMNSHQINNLLDPTGPYDAATKNYVDVLVFGNTNYIHVTNSLQSGSTFYVSSGTVQNDFRVNGTIYGNGSGITSLNPANISAGTAGIDISGNAATATAAISATNAYTAGTLVGGATTYIQLSSTLQPGSTFYVSSGTVAGSLFVGNDLSVKGLNYSWPSSNSVGVLSNNGTGGLSWAPAGAGAYILNNNALQTGSTAYPDFLYVGSSASVQGAGGLGVTYGVSVGSLTLNGPLFSGGSEGSSGYTLQSNGPGAAPSWIAVPGAGSLLSSTNTWTAAQTFQSPLTVLSSVTVNNGATFGAAGQAVTISSNLVVSGAVIASNNSGASGQILQSNGAGAAPTWVNPGSASVLLNSTNTWTAQQTFLNPLISLSSVTVTSPLGVGVTYGVVAGSFTGIGSSLTALTAANISAGTAGIDISGNAATATLAATATNAVTAGSLAGGATTFIQLTETLQVGSTFFVSSGTVNNLNIQSTLQVAGAAGNSGQILQSNGVGAVPTWVNPAAASALLSTNNLWTAPQTFGSSVTVTAPLGVGVTYGIVAGSVTANDLNASQFVKTDGSKKLVSATIGSSDLPANVMYTDANETVTGVKTLTSSVTVTNAGGVNVTYGVVAGSFTGNGTAITSLTGANIATTIPSTVLPSSVAYVSASQTWTGQQTFTSSVTFSSTVVVGNGAGSGGQILQSNGAGSAPTWVNSATVSNGLLSSTNTWTAQQTFQNPLISLSSVTVTAPLGVGVTYGIVAGSVTANDLTASQFVKTDGSKKLVSATIGSSDLPANVMYTDANETVTGVKTLTSSVTVTNAGGVNVTYGVVAGSFTGIGSGLTALTAANISAGTAGIDISGNAATATLAATATNAVTAGSLAGGATTFIQLTETLQVGSTFFVSSGTVNNLNIQSTLQVAGATGSSGQILQSNGAGAAPAWVNSAAAASGLLSSTNTWTAQQTFQNPLISLSSVTVTSPLGVGVTYGVVAGSFTGIGSGLTALTPANISAGTAGIDISGNAATATLAATATNAVTAGSLAGGATTYIQLRDTLQAGATFYTSSGTVDNLNIQSTLQLAGATGSSGQILQSNGAGAAPAWVNSAAAASGLLSSTNTWTASQTYQNPTTMVSSLTVNSAALLGTAGQAVTVSSNLVVNSGGALQVNSLSASQFVKSDANKNLVSATIASGDLPTNVVYTDTNQTISGVKTFTSSVTVTNAALWGAAGQAVTVSSNAYLATIGGNVGIGTTTPNALLHVQASAGKPGIVLISEIGAPLLKLQDPSDLTTLGGIEFLGGSTIRTQILGRKDATTGDSFLFLTDGSSLSEKMRITGSGRIGIGTSIPTTKLHMSSGTLTIDGNTGGINVTAPDGVAATYGVTAATLTLTANAPLSINGSIGSSGQVLQSAGAGAAPTWVNPASASALLSTNNLWTAPQTFGSSVTVTSPLGVGVTYGVVAGSFTGIGSSLTALTAANISAGTAGIDISGNAATATLAATATNAVTAGSLAGGATTYIQLRDTLQAGATFYTSSGTVDNLNIQSTLQVAGNAGLSGQVLQSNGPGAAPTWTTTSADLQSSTNTWTGGQTYISSVTFSSSVVVNNASMAITNGQFGSTINQKGNTGSGAVTIDWSNGNTQHVILTGSPTLTFTNGVSGRKYVLVVKQDATGGHTISWPGTVRFPGGATPTLSTTGDKTDYLAFIYNDVDSTYDSLAFTLNY